MLLKGLIEMVEVKQLSFDLTLWFWLFGIWGTNFLKSYGIAPTISCNCFPFF